MSKPSAKINKSNNLALEHTTTIADNILGYVSNLKDMIRQDNVEVKLNGDTVSVRLSSEEKTYVITYREMKNYNAISKDQIIAPLGQEERASLAKKLYNEGKTQAEIAKIVGCSQKTISNDLKR